MTSKSEDKLKQQIVSYERMLQHPQEHDLKALSDLLDDDFYEMGQSGKIYDKTQIIAYFQRVKSDKSSADSINMFDVKLQIISKEVVLLTYKIKQTIVASKQMTMSLRSSLWRKKNEHWMLVFHQGTPLF